jgi:hypothetical protein
MEYTLSFLRWDILFLGKDIYVSGVARSYRLRFREFGPGHILEPQG